jgi:mannose-1-phosphate guanylyltransferase
MLAEVWPGIRKISIDFGIMEHADRVAVIPVEIGWSDIGSWGALLDVLAHDEQGNVCVGGVLLAADTQGCYVRSDNRLIATIGLDDIIIVDTPDVLLVCPRARAEEVKDLVGRLAVEGKTAYL